MSLEIPPQVQQVLQSDQRLFDKLVALAKMGYNAKEIRKWTNASKTYIYKAINQAQSIGEAPQKPEVHIIPTEEKIPISEPQPPPPPEEEKEEGEKEITEEAVSRFEEGAPLTAEDYEAMLKIPASLYPEGYQPSPQSIHALAQLYPKPFNRLIEKYAKENFDLYLALGMTALVFVTPAVRYVRDQRMKKAEKKKEGEKVESKPQAS